MSSVLTLPSPSPSELPAPKFPSIMAANIKLEATDAFGTGLALGFGSPGGLAVTAATPSELEAKASAPEVFFVKFFAASRLSKVEVTSGCDQPQVSDSQVQASCHQASSSQSAFTLQVFQATQGSLYTLLSKYTKFSDSSANQEES